jgi:hypothetical protein
MQGNFAEVKNKIFFNNTLNSQTDDGFSKNIF